MAVSRRKKKAAQGRISDKISLLRREGKDAKQAAGEAYGMERSGRLRAKGKYIRKGRKSARPHGRYR